MHMNKTKIDRQKMFYLLNVLFFQWRPTQDPKYYNLKKIYVLEMLAKNLE